MGKRTVFEELILAKAYQFKTQNSNILDVIERAGGIPESLVKNVCAKVSIELSDDLDEVCNLLSISKRQFIEIALIEALSKARQIMDDEVEMFEGCDKEFK